MIKYVTDLGGSIQNWCHRIDPSSKEYKYKRETFAISKVKIKSKESVSMFLLSWSHKTVPASMALGEKTSLIEKILFTTFDVLLIFFNIIHYKPK